MHRDPFLVLGVAPDATPEELHDAYRRMVKLHHPDRNGGSADASRRFQEVQQAYDEVRDRPRAAPRRARPDVEERMATLERELREAHAARESARQAARDAVGEAPSPVTTEDSFGRILGDVRDELAERLAGARRHPAVQRVGDLIDGLDDLASRLDR